MNDNITSGRNLNITDKQLAVYDFMVSFHKQKRRWPTTVEICDKFGYSSTGTAYQYIKALVAKKYLVKHESGFVLGRIPSEIPKVEVI